MQATLKFDIKGWKYIATFHATCTLFQIVVAHSNILSLLHAALFVLQHAANWSNKKEKFLPNWWSEIVAWRIAQMCCQYYHPLRNSAESVKSINKWFGLKACCYLLQGGSGEISLEKDELLKFSTDKAHYDQGDENTIFVDYQNITNVVKEGQIIFVDDGLISLKVVKIGKSYLLTTVLNNAKLGSKKGVNLPDVEVDLPALSEQDIKDIHFGVEHGVSVSLITNENIQYNIIVISSLIIC